MYDLLANELGLIHQARTKIIPYVMTWDGVLTTYHKKYVQELNIQPCLEAYIQSVVLKKTLESISLERRRSTDLEEALEEEEVERALVSSRIVLRGTVQGGVVADPEPTTPGETRVPEKTTSSEDSGLGALAFHRW